MMTIGAIQESDWKGGWRWALMPVGVLLALSWAALIWFAPAAQAQTLMEALGAAYVGNPELLAERAKTRAADEAIPQALANWRPEVTVSGSAARTLTHNSTRIAGRDQIRTVRNFGLDVSQSLFRGFRTVASTDRAENQVLAQRARLLDKEQDILLAAAGAFMDVVRDQALIGLNVNNEQVLRRQLEAAEDRFRVGEITRTDVSQAEARLARATADRIKAEGDLEKSRATFKNVIGEAPGQLAGPSALSGLPTSLESAQTQARTAHPDVRAAEFDEKAARDQIDKVKGELLPTISLTGSLDRDFENASNINRNSSASVRASISVPLYQQGDVFSRVREAKQDAGESRLDLDDARRDSEKTATNSWQSLVTARARIKSFTAQVEAAEIALEGVRREAQVGSRTVLDVLDAEQELLDAKVDLVTAQRDEVVASFDLAESVGNLTARKLGLNVDIYDPEIHYRQVRDKIFGSDIPGGGGKNTGE